MRRHLLLLWWALVTVALTTAVLPNGAHGATINIRVHKVKVSPSPSIEAPTKPQEPTEVLTTYSSSYNRRNGVYEPRRYYADPNVDAETKKKRTTIALAIVIPAFVLAVIITYFIYRKRRR